MKHLKGETGDYALESFTTYQTVLPDNNGKHERTHAEDVISLAGTY